MWQLAHWAITTCWLWFHRLGFHALTRWQLMQLTLVGMWPAPLPVTPPVPLWQLAQLVAAVKVA